MDLFSIQLTKSINIYVWKTYEILINRNNYEYDEHLFTS